MTLTGTVQSIIYRNPETGFAILTLIDADNREWTAKGTMPLIDAGEQASFTGELENHPRYGSQLNVRSYKQIAPRTEEALIAYLGGGAVSGIGPSLAAAIVRIFGMDTLRVMEETPTQLTRVPGIGPKKCAAIMVSYNEGRAMREVLLVLAPYGITVKQANKLYTLYGELCLAKIQENPYRMIEDVDGIGFLTADRIAQNIPGFSREALPRIKAGILHALTASCSEYGHTYLPRDKLAQRADEFLGVGAEAIADTIEWMIGNGELIYEMTGDCDALFLPYYARAEEGIAKRLRALSKAPAQNHSRDIAACEDRLQIDLSEQQRSAVLAALDNGVQVITGGPGTGKTTIIKCILELMQDAGFRVALAAPTGRAAKRMTEATGHSAFTLHRLLGYQPDSGFQRNEDDPLEEDVVIVDEMSMVDVLLMNALLRALRPHTRLILVGDGDQLPSVGSGNVLRDIMESRAIPTVQLTEIFRQARESRIVTNAHRINRGTMPVLNEPDSDFVFEPLHAPEAILHRIIELVTRDVSRLRTENPKQDVQVLCPGKKDTIGVANLNAALQNALNPPAWTKAETKIGNANFFREGDKVMHTKNNYKLEWTRAVDTAYGETEGMGVFNGDMGIITEIDNAARMLRVEFDDGRIADYDFLQAQELDLAYAVTIHKSQGSEFPVILLPLAGGNPLLLTRNLLYTAVTRAKSLVYCIGRSATLAQMVRTNQSRIRFTSLRERLSTKE